MDPSRSRTWPAACVAVVLAIFPTVAALPAQQSTLELAQRLSIAKLHIDGLDVPYDRELARLNGICASSGDAQACGALNLRPLAVKSVPVYGGASTGSAILGEIVAVLQVRAPHGLGYRLEYLPRGAQPVIWIDDVGDWTFGIEIPGVRTRGTWIQLFGAPFARVSWINGATPSVTAGTVAQVEPIEGHLLWLPALPAAWPDGRRGPITAGSYLVERIRDNEITVRAEIPTDFPCSEVLKNPSVKPSSVRIAVRDFFSPEGDALFSYTYWRGC